MGSQDNYQTSCYLKLEDFTDCTWGISRQIHDYKYDSELSFTGQCEILDGWYNETGETVLLDGQTLVSCKRYRWYAITGGVDVHFDDGRFFHWIDLKATAPQASHFCGPDDYAVSYDFMDWPVWTARWIVKGPKKDYEIHSCYRKITL